MVLGHKLATISTGMVLFILLVEFSFLRILAFGGEVCPGLTSLAKLKHQKVFVFFF